MSSQRYPRLPVVCAPLPWCLSTLRGILAEALTHGYFFAHRADQSVAAAARSGVIREGEVPARDYLELVDLLEGLVLLAEERLSDQAPVEALMVLESAIEHAAIEGAAHWDINQGRRARGLCALVHLPMDSTWVTVALAPVVERLRSDLESAGIPLPGHSAPPTTPPEPRPPASSSDTPDEPEQVRRVS